MKIIGCDFHPSWQQVAIFDSSTGEILEHKLVNGNGEAERFYGSLPRPSLVGLESRGNSEWFVELVQRLGHQVWIGDAAGLASTQSGEGIGPAVKSALLAARVVLAAGGDYGRE